MSTSADTQHLSVESLGLTLDEFQLRDVSFGCDEGEYRILLGPTGSGKSTLIKCLLGLHQVERGRIVLGGREITNEPPERRGMGYVPQSYALFPHMTAEQNIRFGINAKQPPKAEADKLLGELCEMLGIGQLRQRSVRNLSGGEKQKVALARALGTRPRTILLDEPFSSIDEGSRRQLWFELKQVISEIGVTALHITHNLDEAHVMGERLSVLIDGRLVQQGTPQDILERPASEPVARFLGYRNVFHGKAQPIEGGTRIELGQLSIVVNEKFAAGERLGVCVRQQDIKILKQDSPLKSTLERNVFSGTLTNLFAQPETCTAWFSLAGSDDPRDLELRFPRYLLERHDLEAGQRLSVALWEPAIVVWREDGLGPSKNKLDQN
ncbi:MAG: ATP-binding cassette domain-containing protein [Deltaproteobacteria bacterium]|nr:ATP-binding cassette domain-containing protein [Deltaproteobacteria bacterium]